MLLVVSAVSVSLLGNVFRGYSIREGLSTFFDNVLSRLNDFKTMTTQKGVSVVHILPKINQNIFPCLAQQN